MRARRTTYGSGPRTWPGCADPRRCPCTPRARRQADALGWVHAVVQVARWVSDDAGLGDGDLGLGAAALRAVALDLADQVQARLVGHPAEDDVLAVQPGGHHGGDEELRAVGVGAGVGHRQQARLGVLELEVLVRELLTV